MTYCVPTPSFQWDSRETTRTAEQILRDQLSESQRQFQSVLNSLSGLFYRCELEAPWRMSFVSAGVQALTGYEPEDLQSQGGWSDIMRVEDRAAVESAVSKAVFERRSFELSYRITHRKGEIRWVCERGRAIYREDGTPLFLEGVIRDVSGRQEADELQKTMLERWRRTLDAIPQMVWTMAGDGSNEFYNAQWLLFTGCTIGVTEDLARADLVHAEDRPKAMALWRDRFRSGEPYEAQYRLKHVSGDYRWVLSRGRCEKDSAGAPIRWYGTCTDIHDEVLGLQALQSSEAVNRSMIEASPDCISLLDVHGNTQFLNRSALAAVGLKSADPLVGQSWADAFPSSIRPAAAVAVRRAAAGGTGRFTATRASCDGARWWDIVVAPIRGDNSELSGLVSIARDITDQKTAEERVRWAANHDALTQLPNRTLFQHTLDRMLAEARASGGAVTVLMMDLDDFKRTNDALGHDAGDALLAEFAIRLRETAGADNMVARLGGDEFAVLLNGVSEKADVEAAGNAIRAGLKAPCEFEGKLLDIRTSVGASTFPQHGATRTELMRHADIALYVAKGTGRGGLRLFEASMRADAQKRLSMLGLARDALRQDRILPYYQPKVDLRTGRLDGFEALLRWTHPRNGIQAAETISAAFHDAAFAAEISDRMIDSVIADMRRWTDAGVPFGHVAVNAGGGEFKSRSFADTLLERLHRAQLSPTCLQLEVTETVFIGRGAEHVQDALRTLSAEGIGIALDDFGTGYASLSHLKDFPVNVLKIDRSFVGRLETSDRDAAIVRAVIKLGRSLGIRIVAEGIESQRQADFLKKHRCHSGQGYLFGKAMPASVAESQASTWDKSRLAA